MYNELDNTKDEEQLKSFITSLTDRFGVLPQTVIDLTESVRMRWEAEKLGFEKLKLTGGLMKGYVTVENNDEYFQSDIFGKVLAYIQQNPATSSFREHRGKMIISFKEISSIEEAVEVMQLINGL